MKREQLEHVLRACAAIVNENSFVVVGSQAVLLPHPNAPSELLLSNEIDLYPAVHPELADLIDGAIGALSMFHDTYGYYADGVGPQTARMPGDWMEFATLHYIGEITVVCPDLHDLAVAKSVAGRERRRLGQESVAPQDDRASPIGGTDRIARAERRRNGSPACVGSAPGRRGGVND